MAGIEALDSSIDGKSLLPLLEGRTDSLERDLFWHFPHYHAGGDGPYSAIRSGDWKLIERLEDDTLELYDLEADPGEQSNIVDSDPAAARRLQEKLLAWRKEVGAQMPTVNPGFDPERALEVGRKR